MSIVGNIVKSIKKGSASMQSKMNPPSQYEQMMTRGEEYRQQIRRGVGK